MTRNDPWRFPEEITEVVEREQRIIDLPDTAVMDAFALANAAKVEAQGYEAGIAEGPTQMVDDAAMHAPAL